MFAMFCAVARNNPSAFAPNIEVFHLPCRLWRRQRSRAWIVTVKPVGIGRTAHPAVFDGDALHLGDARDTGSFVTAEGLATRLGKACGSSSPESKAAVVPHATQRFGLDRCKKITCRGGKIECFGCLHRAMRA
jgi:hypothetical protein